MRAAHAHMQHTHAMDQQFCKHMQQVAHLQHVGEEGCGGWLWRLAWSWARKIYWESRAWPAGLSQSASLRARCRPWVWPAPAGGAATDVAVRSERKRVPSV